MIRIALINIAIVIAFTVSASAKIDGVNYIDMEIGGQTYSVPIYNPLIKNDFYLVKRMLIGDELAREMLLGGYEEKLMFIGDGDTVRWLKITQTTQEVIEY